MERRDTLPVPPQDVGGESHALNGVVDVGALLYGTY
jgi:hypothetical protein